MAENWKEHQQRLAQSGNRVPDSFYAAAAAEQPTTEKKSGDGGSAVMGKARTADDAPPTADPAEVGADMEALRTVDPDTGLTIPDSVRRQAAGEEPDTRSRKSKAGPKENKSDDK